MGLRLNAIRWRNDRWRDAPVRHSGCRRDVGPGNVARLQEDHDNATRMMEQLREAGADVTRQDTNMLFSSRRGRNAAALGEYMKARNVLINASLICPPGDPSLTSHVNNWRKLLLHWQRSWRVKERETPQRILVPVPVAKHWSASGAHALASKGIRSWRRHVMSTDLVKLQWLMSVAIKSISTGRITFRPCCRILILLYFLVHSMGEGGDFIAQERQVALNVRDELREVPVKQLIFLSSLQAPPHEQSDHLRARQATADILREAGVPVTELRAGIIVGAGSAAFEVMRDMVYNLPVLTPPRWVRSRTTPIALENLLHYLVALLDHPPANIASSKPPDQKCSVISNSLNILWR